LIKAIYNIFGDGYTIALKKTAELTKGKTLEETQADKA